jgi:hypothetical protein
MDVQSDRKTDAKPDPKKPHQIPLTREEQDILNGSKVEAMVKIMKIVVAHGNAFGADKLLDLGGAPHTSMYFGMACMAPLIKIFDECTKDGLKAYATPYTVNPRPYEGYALQREVDYIHSPLGSPDFNYRSCACYVDELDNAPKPGTYMA